MRVETRATAELRAVDGRRLLGYAAVFNTPTRIGTFEEVVLPGAFAASLRLERDVLLLADHDKARVLARTRTGSLVLEEDARGLRFETGPLPGTTAANDVLELVRSGNAGGASFAFQVEQGGERWTGRDRRELRAVRLVEVSVVSAWPAYDGTEVATRRRPGPRLIRALRLLEAL